MGGRALRVLGLIPARAGSKGIPGKNLRRLGGRTLIERARDAARDSGVVDRLVLSTDCERTAEHGRALGIEVAWLRPPELALDTTPMIDVAVHALAQREARELDPDVLLLLQPTAPLRTSEHIRAAVGLLAPGVGAVVSVHPLPRELSPHFLMRVEDGRLSFFLPDGVRYTRRQDVPLAYKRDGSIYLTRASVIRDERSFYGDHCRPLIVGPNEVLNLDTMEDWERAVRLLGE